MKKIFIDCGANKGQSIEYALKFVLGQNKDYKIYSFETLPLLANRLKDFYSKNPKIEVFNNAVWIEDTDIKFYVSPRSTESGSILVDKLTGGLSKDAFIVLKAIDFSKWLQENVNPEDYVILKLDIEGAEYEVLSHLIQEGTIGLIDEFRGEFHKHKLKITSELQKCINTVEEYFKDVTFTRWEIPSSYGVIDYKKGTKPSLASAKITSYDSDGTPIFLDKDNSIN